MKLTVLAVIMCHPVPLPGRLLTTVAPNRAICLLFTSHYIPIGDVRLDRRAMFGMDRQQFGTTKEVASPGSILLVGWKTATLGLKLMPLSTGDRIWPFRVLNGSTSVTFWVTEQSISRALQKCILTHIWPWHVTDLELYDLTISHIYDSISEAPCISYG